MLSGRSIQDAEEQDGDHLVPKKTLKPPAGSRKPLLEHSDSRMGASNISNGHLGKIWANSSATLACLQDHQGISRMALICWKLPSWKRSSGSCSLDESSTAHVHQTTRVIDLTLDSPRPEANLY